jgi:hypothetical protein
MLDMAFTPGRTNDGKEIKSDILWRPGSYGFGWFISSIHGEKDVEHSGGWAGSVTEILRVPSRRISVILLTNSSNDELLQIAPQMVAIAEKN